MSGKPRDGRTYTNAEAAQILGVDQATVKRWRARGWLVTRANGTLDAAATAARVDARRDPTLGGRPDRGVGGAPPVQPVADVPPRPPLHLAPRTPPRSFDSGPGSSSDAARLLQARALRETFAAKRLRLAVEREEGKTVDREAAEHAFAEVIVEVRSALEAIPARVASRLVGLDAVAIRKILREEIEAALWATKKAIDLGNNDGGTR